MTKRGADIMGWVLIATCVLGFALCGFGAYSIDRANGVSVDQSLRSVGL